MITTFYIHGKRIQITHEFKNGKELVHALKHTDWSTILNSVEVSNVIKK
jgi:hypothetical protein